MSLSVALPVLAAAAISEPPVERIVVTAERQPQAFSQALLAPGVVDGDTLARVSPQHPQQVLNRIAGVHFQRNGGQEYLAAIRSPVLTGAGSCGAFLSLENGVPIRPAPFCNVNELSESLFETAGHIEVIRGPALAFYGANAMHGAVNVLTPSADSRATLLLSDYAYRQFDLVYGTADQQVALALLHDDSWRDSAGTDQQKLGWRRSDSSDHWQIETTVTGSHLEQQTAGFINGTDAYQDLARSRHNDNPDAFRNSESLRLVQRWQHDQGLQLTPYLRYSDMHFLQHFLPGQPDERNGHWSAGLQSQWPLIVAAQHELLVGVDAEYADTFVQQWQRQPTEGSAYLRETIPLGFHYDYRVQLTGFAPFVHARWQPLPRVQLFAGLRWEYWRYAYDNQMVDGRSKDDGTACGFDGCRFSRPADRTDTFSLPSPKLGALWQVADDSQLRLHFMHGFRPPQTSELYRLQREQTVAELEPEQLSGIELAWDSQWRDLATLALAAYHYDKRNGIVRNTDAYTVAGAETDHRGVELSVDLALAAQWSLALAASWQRHTYENNPGISAADIIGNRVDTAPDQIGFAALRWQPNPATTLELSAQAVSDYYTDAENLHRYDGHVVADLRWQQALTNHWQLRVQLLNLADTRYAERADYTSASGDRYMPGAPRQLYVGVQAAL